MPATSVAVRMNLKTLAKTLGLSKTTVSRALNGYPEVNEKTRQRVLAVARDIGYRPNPSARNLAIGRTNVIGIIYPMLPGDLGDAMFLDVVNGMTGRLAKASMDLIIVPVTSPEKLDVYEHMVRDKRVDGLIVGRTRVHDERIAYLARHGLPFIAYGRTQIDHSYAWFDYDNETGIRLATEHLLSLGHRHIAYIGSPPELNFAFQRIGSFLGTLHSAGIDVNPAYLVNNALSRPAGYHAMQQLLACSPRPTAVLVDNHLAGAGAVFALLDARIAIGSELSLIVWGNMEDVMIGRKISSVTQPDLNRAGIKIAEMMLALLDGAPPSELQELWRPVLLAGETVAAP
jgi:LacI family transcriptional regulator